MILSKLKKIAARTDKWLTKASAYMYNFKDGHFQFPYVSNDPELMVEALKKTPFVVHNKAMQCLETNSSLMKIKLKYLNIEEGLWLTSTQSTWKVNVKAIALPCDSPSDYYFLTYSRLTNHVQVVINDNEYLFENNNKAWTFYKANTALDAYFQKKCKSFAVVFMFNRAWLERNIFNNSTLNQNVINQLINADNAYKTYIYNDKLIDQKFNGLQLEINDVPVKNIDMSAFLHKSKEYILDFFTNISINAQENYAIEKIIHKDRTRMEMVDKLLSETIISGFLGIEAIAKKNGISPSKLKSDFKAVFGMSIFQYYQKKQMELAVKMLKEHYPINEIAKTLGYENQSKFSAKFKDIHGVLPSKYF